MRGGNVGFADGSVRWFEPYKPGVVNTMAHDYYIAYQSSYAIPNRSVFIRLHTNGTGVVDTNATTPGTGDGVVLVNGRSITFTQVFRR